MTPPDPPTPRIPEPCYYGMLPRELRTDRIIPYLEVATLVALRRVSRRERRETQERIREYALVPPTMEELHGTLYDPLDTRLKDSPWWSMSPRMVFRTQDGVLLLCCLSCPNHSSTAMRATYQLCVNSTGNGRQYKYTIEGTFIVDADERYEVLTTLLALHTVDGSLELVHLSAPHYLRVLRRRVMTYPALSSEIGTLEQRRNLVRSGHLRLYGNVMSPLLTCSPSVVVATVALIRQQATLSEYARDEILRRGEPYLDYTHILRARLSRLCSKPTSLDEFVSEALGSFLIGSIPEDPRLIELYQGLLHLVDWCTRGNYVYRVCHPYWDRTYTTVSRERMMEVITSLCYWYVVSDAWEYDHALVFPWREKGRPPRVYS